MSYLETLQQHNASLQSLIDTANNLPEAGGGGGGSVETCTVTVNLNSYVVYTTYSDSSGMHSIYDTNSQYGRSILVVKGSLIFTPLSSYYTFVLPEGVTILEQNNYWTLFSVASDVADAVTIFGYYSD